MQSLKAILHLTLVVAMIATVLACAADGRVTSTVWAWRIGSPVVAGTVTWLLWRISHRKEIFPDLLARACGTYFEGDGLCFAFVLTVEDNVCVMNLFFQNRYQHPCNARIVVQPPVKPFGFRRHPLVAIDIEVDCDGGAFEVCRIPWPITASLQGKTLNCEVACDTVYPQGRGKLLRFREGLRAGFITSVRRTNAAGILPISLAVSVSRPARMRLRLPTGVADKMPAGVAPSMQTIFRPDLPTGGFPVVQISSGEQR